MCSEEIYPPFPLPVATEICAAALSGSETKMFILTLCQSKLKPFYLVSLLQSLHGEKSIVFTSSVESTHRLCTLHKFFNNLQIEFKEYSLLQCQSERRVEQQKQRWGQTFNTFSQICNHFSRTL